MDKWIDKQFPRHSIALLAFGAFSALASYASHVFMQLSAIRPLLVFVFVNGVTPPICGFSLI